MESQRKSLFKAVSWRVIGSAGTLVVSWWYTGSFAAGAAISSIEFVAKIGLFYVHERIWSRVQ
jgi:uncharacterized membrane protein